ncbi:hypothetical protein [Streptomyces sp. NPDC093225]|uniref:hypothetical protein n=1 Tax=Streptomyces sp. NPDC093225 TaxID=3366034 RepID=UPI00380D204E
MPKRYWRIWVPVAVLGAVAGGVVFVPDAVEHVRRERAVEALWRAHQGPPARLLKEAGERALAAGAAEVLVTAENPLSGESWPEPGRMSWQSPHDALTLPGMSRWRIDDDVYYYTGYDGNPEVEWERGTAAVSSSAPDFLSTLLVGGDAKRVGPGTVGGRLVMHYSTAVERTAHNTLLRKTFPCLAPPVPDRAVPGSPADRDPRIHVDAWLDDNGQPVRMRMSRPQGLPDSTIEFRSFGGPAVTLPQGANRIPPDKDPRTGCTTQ